MYKGIKREWFRGIPPDNYVITISRKYSRVCPGPSTTVRVPMCLLFIPNPLYVNPEN